MGISLLHIGLAAKAGASATRKAGFEHKDWVRYPVGKEYAHKCLYALSDPKYEYNKGTYRKLDYVTARKEIYARLYIELVKQEKLFDELKERLLNGENLLIIENHAIFDY